MTEDRKPSRLPPPAFPPPGGHSGGPARASAGGHGGAAASRGQVDEAFYYPDEPGEESAAFPLISPDDPSPEVDFEEGTVTGIGADTHVAPEGVGSRDPHVAALTTAVETLAEGLRRRGEAGLHASPDMSRFEATLRAYCVGYLAGRRAESNEG